MPKKKPSNVHGYGELASDAKFTTNVQSLRGAIDKANTSIQTLCTKSVYAKLSTKDKVDYDLFIAYSINSLYWMYLRTQGIDPNYHQVKEELNRIRAYMNQSKQIHDRKTKMPRLNKEVAQRFVRSGLWQRREELLNDKYTTTESKNTNVSTNQLNKKEGGMKKKKKRVLD